MKLNSVSAFLLLSTSLAVASASAEDVLVLDDGAAGKNSMTWPMLPGESLNELAAKFYPKNKVMQRLFTAKTLVLNAETLPNLSDNADFSVPTAIVIPTLKSLSYGAPGRNVAQNKSGRSSLQMSSNMTEAVQRVPKSLLDEYEYLVTRNTFLKEELAKLNEKLIFLQNKLSDLKLILDKTMALPPKKVLKNLDAKRVKTEAKPALEQVSVMRSFMSMLNSINKDALLAALGLALVAGLSAYLYKTSRKNARRKSSTSAIQLQATTALDDGWKQTQQQSINTKTGVPLNADTQVDDLNERSILDEAKFLMGKNQPAEAVEHIKWSIRAQPKAAPNLWLYLLEILKQTNQKEEFENYAKAMHQTFNVMTPVWEEKNLAMVFAQSVEEFPHIVEKLTALWPAESAMDYLHSLINDNRNGERTGFGKEVVEEILLLIAVLEQRGDSI